nr:myosin-15 isoform X1 [Ipomoea batatas]
MLVAKIATQFRIEKISSDKRETIREKDICRNSSLRIMRFLVVLRFWILQQSVIQGQLRTFIALQDFISKRATAIILQSCCRGLISQLCFISAKEANEAGALRLAKSKLEKQLEDLTWRLQLEKKCGDKNISNEEAKLMEISKLQKTVESLSLELDAAKLSTKSLAEFEDRNSALERELANAKEEASGPLCKVKGMLKKNVHSYRRT